MFSIPILVKFKSYEQKLEIMKKKKLANANFSGISKDIGKVFINENLTLFSRDLLYHTMKFQKANDWKFSWSSDGNVLESNREYGNIKQV